MLHEKNRLAIAEVPIPAFARRIVHWTLALAVASLLAATAAARLAWSQE